MIDVLLDAGANINARSRVVGGRLRRARRRGPGTRAVPARAWRDPRCALGRPARHARGARDGSSSERPGARARPRRGRADAAALCLDCRDGAAAPRPRRRHRRARCRSRVDAGAIHGSRSSGGRALSRRSRLPHGHSDGGGARRSRARAASTWTPIRRASACECRSVFFPKQDPRSGGTIYTWTLGADKTAHAVARERRHAEVLAELVRRSPATLQLAVAAQGRRRAARAATAGDGPDLVSQASRTTNAYCWRMRRGTTTCEPWP